MRSSTASVLRYDGTVPSGVYMCAGRPRGPYVDSVPVSCSLPGRTDDRAGALQSLERTLNWPSLGAGAQLRGAGGRNRRGGPTVGPDGVAGWCEAAGVSPLRVLGPDLCSRRPVLLVRGPARHSRQVGLSIRVRLPRRSPARTRPGPRTGRRPGPRPRRWRPRRLFRQPIRSASTVFGTPPAS